jgi:PAP2 superfamily
MGPAALPGDDGCDPKQGLSDLTERRRGSLGSIAVVAFSCYVALLVVVMFTQGIEVLPDRYAVAMLIGAIILGRGRRFIADWSPFIGLLISYDFLRGFADDLAGRAEFVLPMHADAAIFGVVPTVFLQRAFLNVDALQWYDYAATLLYFMHFVLPLGFAMVLWLRDRNQFTEFAASLTILSYAAWLTYLVFPSAPPWLAAQNGYLDGVTRVLGQTINFLPDRLDLPSIYRQLNPNAVAAIPSLHAAYPSLVLLFALRFFGRRGIAVGLYVAAVWLAVVYLGEHYAIDVMLGAIYAGAAFALGPVAVRLIERIRDLRAERTPSLTRA